MPSLQLPRPVIPRCFSPLTLRQSWASSALQPFSQRSVTITHGCGSPPNPFLIRSASTAPWLHLSPIFSSRKPNRSILLTTVSPLTTSTSQTISALPPLISAARDGPSSPAQLPDLGSLSQNAVRVTSRPSSAANYLALPPFSTAAFSTIPPAICKPPTRPAPPKQLSTRSSPGPPTNSA